MSGARRVQTVPPPRSAVSAGGSALTSSTQTQFRSLNRRAFLPVLMVAGTVTVIVESRNWPDAVVLAAGVIAAGVAFVSWTAGTLMRVAVPCLAVAALVWIYGVQVAGSATAFFGISVVGTLAVPQFRSHRGVAAVGLAVFVAAVGMSRLWVTSADPWQEVIAFVVVPTAITVVVTALMFPNKWFYDVVRDLEESRERDAELAVIRERFRFASDLHDIQGHTLHVVKLKITLAQKLLGSDTRRVEQELAEIHTLISDTITQTKDLAYAQRRLNLSAELENAKNLFEAAGIRVRIDREADSDARLSEQLGQVLRETTTNILRHAQATHVRITLSEQAITVVNNGARSGAVPTLRGLDTLKRRLADEGGELTVRVDGDRFVTAAVFGPARAATTPTREDRT